MLIVVNFNTSISSRPLGLRGLLGPILINSITSISPRPLGPP